MLPIIAALALHIPTPPPPPAPDPVAPEAAPRYYHLFARHDRDLSLEVAEIDVGFDEFKMHPTRAVDPERPPLTPAEARRLLLDAAPLIEGYSAAARLPAGDLGLDPFPDAHFDFDNPRSRMVPSFNDAIRLIRADAVRAWFDDDRATFWRHAATIIRIGAHLAAQSASDSTCHTLAGLHVEMGMDLAARAIDRGAIPDEPARAELRAALACIPADDPTSIRRWWCRDWRRRLDEARATLAAPDPERAATLHLSKLRNGLIFGRQAAARIEDLFISWELSPPTDFFERARGWIIWTYWPAVYEAIDAGLIPALPRPFIENRLANAEALCLRAEQAWSAGAPPDRFTAIMLEANRDSTALATTLLVSVPALRSEDLAVRARIEEFRARLDSLPH